MELKKIIQSYIKKLEERSKTYDNDELEDSHHALGAQCECNLIIEELNEILLKVN